jgi:hypothetical protein
VSLRRGCVINYSRKAERAAIWQRGQTPPLHWFVSSKQTKIPDGSAYNSASAVGDQRSKRRRAAQRA